MITLEDQLAIAVEDEDEQAGGAAVFLKSSQTTRGALNWYSSDYPVRRQALSSADGGMTVGLRKLSSLDVVGLHDTGPSMLCWD